MTTIGTSTSSVATKQSAPQILVASDGTAIALYFDGSNNVFRTASSPYTSWSSTTTVAASPNLDGCAACIDGSDNVYVAYREGSTQRPAFRLLTKSGSTWTVGSQVIISTSVQFGFDLDDRGYILREAGGRLWVVLFSSSPSNVLTAWYSDNSGTSWSQGAQWAQNPTGGVPAVNWGAGFATDSGTIYLVVAWATSGNGKVNWDRHKLTNSATTWDGSQASSTDFNLTAGADGWAIAQDTNGKLLVASGTSGGAYNIRTVLYNPSSNAWGTQTDVGLASGDTYPTAITFGSKVYLLWSAFQATNNYSIVYKSWDGSSWSGATTLEAAGNNDLLTAAGGNSSALMWLWAQGTGSPWNVNFDLLTFTTTSHRTITATAALLATSSRSITATAALLATSTRTISASAALQGTSSRTIAATSALLQTSNRSISSSAALLSTNTRTIVATAALQAIRSIPATAALWATSRRTIPATASLSTGAGPPPNATFWIRSGHASAIITN